MFDTAHYLHYVLDTKHDDHFTDDLLRLSPEAYLWHELKECHGFANVVFVSTQEQKLELEVFDNQTRQLLQPPKKIPFAAPKQPDPDGILRARFSPSKCGQTDSSLLPWLLKLQKDSKKDKTALVCTWEALDKMYRCSTVKGKDLLRSLTHGKSPSAIMVVRLELDTAALQQAFWNKDCCLTELDDHIKAVLSSGVQRPLLTMLAEQLKDQLVDFSGQYTEIRNMLLYEALTDPDCRDSMAQQEDQAEYLRLCCLHNLGLAEYLGGHTSHEPLKRNTIREKLKDPNFRSILRSKAARLRQSGGSAPMAELFCSEQGIPSDLCSCRDLRCDDTLARKVETLSLPAEYTEKHYQYTDVPQQAYNAVSTLWNKGRNDMVCDMIRSCCDAACTASDCGDWDTLTDSLKILQLCSGNICADPALEDNLQEIFAVGEEVLGLSANYFHQSSSMHAIYTDSSLESYMVSADELVVRLEGETSLEAKEKRLSARRSNLHHAIVHFNEYPLSDRVKDILDRSVDDMKMQLDQNMILMDHPGYPDDTDDSLDGFDDNTYDL